MKITAADALSIFPFAQQIVGASTVLSNTVKLLIDIADLVTAKFAEIIGTKAREKRYDALIENGRELKTHYQECKRAGLLRQQRENEQVMLGCRRNIEQHVKFIGVGLLRAVPVAGTVFSIVRISRVL